MRKGRFSLSWPPDLAHLRFPFGHCQAIRTHRLAGGGSIMKRNVTHRILPRREELAPYPPTTTARPRVPLRDRAVAGFATSVGLCPPYLTHPATVSHPDRRFTSGLSRRNRLPNG